MKITKYPQSCLLLEKDNKRLVIDPGSLVSPTYKASDLLPINGILITHEHSDHIDPDLINSILADKSVPVVGNENTGNVFNSIITKVIRNGEEFDLAGFHIQARELPHVSSVDGSPVPQNTGYIIDGVFFHPGDGISIDGVKVETAATPIAGPDISPRDVYSFIKQVGCKTVIPIHYDYYPADPKFYARLLSGIDKSLNVVAIANGESVEI